MDGAVNEYGNVLSALSHYFNALHLKQPDEMRKVWHPLCHLRRPSGDGGVTDIPAKKFLEIVAANSGHPDDHPADLAAKQHLADNVQSIAFATPGMAVAKVNITLGRTTYTDFLALLKLREGWRIVSKLFAPRDAALAAPFDTTALASSHAELNTLAAAYLHARRTANSPGMGALLHPCCQIFTERDGDVFTIPRADFIADLPTFSVYGEKDAQSLGPRRFDRLVSIDKSGPDTALLKLCVGSLTPAGDERLILDHLMTIRVGGGWRIVSRVYKSFDL